MDNDGSGSINDVQLGSAFKLLGEDPYHGDASVCTDDTQVWRDMAETSCQMAQLVHLMDDMDDS